MFLSIFAGFSLVMDNWGEELTPGKKSSQKVQQVLSYERFSLCWIMKFWGENGKVFSIKNAKRYIESWLFESTAS